MSELFDDDPRTAPPDRSGSRRSRALIITAVVLVVAFFGITTFAGIYTDRLWYDAGGYGSVFSTLYLTRIGLFIAFAVSMAVVVGVNIVVAYRLRPLFRPPSSEQNGLDRYREAITPIRVWLLAGICLVLGVFAGTSGAGEWRRYLLWRNGGDFGQTDEFFKKDIGFYVFDLPWYHYLVDYAMAVLVIALLAAAVVHYLYGGIRLQVTRDRLSSSAQAQLSVLLGLFVLVKAVDYWLDRFDLATRSGNRFTGMNYTGFNAVLPAKEILMFVALICAVLFFVNVWRRTWLLPSVGLALLAVSAVLLGMIWPGVVQQFQVKPSEADKENKFIAANIEATRTAYDVADVDVQSYSDPADTSGTTATTLEGQASSIPLVDPKLVQQTFDQQQQARAYYSVADVLDVDRYIIDGNDRALVLGLRELDQTGINAGDRNWTNLHTVYTHGNGVIAAYANQRNAADQAETNEIQWAEVGRSGTGDDNKLAEGSPDGTYESRIYFGEKSPDYSVVGTPPGGASVELDLGSVNGVSDPSADPSEDPAASESADPSTDASADASAGASASPSDSPSPDAATSADDGDERTTTYDGDGGVDIGSSFRQFLYAVKFGEPNFLLSGRVNSSSQVLYNRQPIDRVEKVAPWLTIDSDPYPVVVDGKIQWVLDGYTTTDRFPGAERESFETMTDDALQDNTGLRTLPTDEINYMRNAVKATVDAYDGTVKIYEWDESDPILQAWMGAFPGTVLPKSDIPDDLIDHLRYPEDLFKVQRYQYARYHVTNAGDFYQGNDRWEVPVDPNNKSSLQPPYRLFLDEPNVGNVWSLTSTFVPRGRNTLASFVSVNSDANSSDYGKLTVLELPTNAQTNGPGLIANEFSNNSAVRDALLPFQQSTSQPVYGNLLTLPVASGLIYVEPVYAVRSASASGFPELTFVLVSYGQNIGIGATLTEAIGNALTGDGTTAPTDPTDGGTTPPTDGGTDTPTDGGSATPGTGTINEQIRNLLDQADTAFAAANAALDAGDLAGYQTNVTQAQTLVSQAVALADQRDGTTGGVSPSAGASATP